MNDDDVVPRYLVLVGGCAAMEFENESTALNFAESMLGRSVEVVRSIRRWGLDVETGEMLEVGEKLKQLETA